jgi:hypothetical protein
VPFAIAIEQEEPHDETMEPRLQLDESSAEPDLRRAAKLQHIQQYLGLVVEIHQRARADLSGRYLCLEELLLEHGETHPLSSRSFGVPRGPAHECFKNAADLVLSRRDLLYCEGFAMGVIPVLHAWCLDASGAVVEPTWTEELASGGYFGLVFRRHYVWETLLARQKYGLLDNPEMDWPLLWRRCDMNATVRLNAIGHELAHDLPSAPQR